MNFRAVLLSSSLPVCLGSLLVSCGPVSTMKTTGGSDYLAGLGVSSVSTVPANPAEASSFWDGDSVYGSPSIRINVRKQEAFFYKNGELVGLAPISSGDEMHDTPRGTYKVTEKQIDHRSSRYGRIVDRASGVVVNNDADSQIHKPGPGQVFEGAPMPFFLRFNYGIGMHAGHLPGYAASHGCVRMPREMAKKFFENAPLGTPVIVD